MGARPQWAAIFWCTFTARQHCHPASKDRRSKRQWNGGSDRRLIRSLNCRCASGPPGVPVSNPPACLVACRAFSKVEWDRLHGSSSFGYQRPPGKLTPNQLAGKLPLQPKVEAGCPLPEASLVWLPLVLMVDRLGGCGPGNSSRLRQRNHISPFIPVRRVPKPILRVSQTVPQLTAHAVGNLGGDPSS